MCVLMFVTLVHMWKRLGCVLKSHQGFLSEEGLVRNCVVMNTLSKESKTKVIVLIQL